MLKKHPLHVLHTFCKSYVFVVVKGLSLIIISTNIILFYSKLKGLSYKKSDFSNKYHFNQNWLVFYGALLKFF
ncbi:hypothetical protein D9X91_06545 [Falsibacillus albus]|uniref:Uncharacterized protein n=1 Tax=Falsibacillus albus TaxID=2478915 RepID=A0A3L7K2B4_9BACI|nr:hypothetical protein D9X91_06545 [Falsibacillus albus]